MISLALQLLKVQGFLRVEVSLIQGVPNGLHAFPETIRSRLSMPAVGCATEFIQDLANRLANRVQLTTDGLKVYLNAVIDAFADDIDYAQLIKVFGADPAG